MAELKSSNRRSFLKQSSYASIGLIGLKSFALADIPADEKRKLTIVHTNDMHSHVEPFAANHPKYPGLGGMAVRAAMIDELRSKHENLLLLDAGDIFQGTPYFNFFGGHLELELMSMMGYDAATMGNHDFDNGMDGFVEAQVNAKFPFLCSNYKFEDTPLEGKTKPYQVFKKGGIRIGVFGLGVALEGLVDPVLCKGVRYEDPILRAQQMSNFLKVKKRCDLIICLSHLGYQYNHDKVSDLVIANSVNDIDLIIGGHTHTFLDSPTKVPKSGDQFTYVNQVGWAGVKLGVLEFETTAYQGATGTSMRSINISEA